VASPRYRGDFSPGLVQVLENTQNSNKNQTSYTTNFNKIHEKLVSCEGTPKSFKTCTKIQLGA